MRNSENGSEISLGGLEMSTLAKVDAPPPMSLGEDSLLNNHEHPPPQSRYFPKYCEIF